MADVLVFHHALGLTAGVVAFADELRSAGHRVETPDLFDGRVFDTVDEGVAYVEEIGGFGELLRQGQLVADDHGPAVYVGFSVGVVIAQMLAQTSAHARGAVLCYSCLPMSEFGESWPATVPVQIHGMDADRFFIDDGDIEAAQAIVAGASNAELFLYGGDRHLFADSSRSDFDAGAAAVLTRRVVDFLAGL